MKIPDLELERAVKCSESIFGVLVKLKLKVNGGNYRTVNRRIKELALDTSHFKDGRKRGVKRPIEYFEEYDKYDNREIKRRYIEEGLLKEKCYCCGETHWNKQKLKLMLKKHKNEFKLYCPNCYYHLNDIDIIDDLF